MAATDADSRSRTDPKAEGAHEVDLERLLDVVPNAVIIADERGRIAFANSQAEALFHYTRAELLAATVEALVPARYRSSHRRLRQEFLREPSIRAMGAGRDLFGVRKDGSEFPIDPGRSNGAGAS